MRSLRLHAWTTRIHVTMTDDGVWPAVQQITEAFLQDVDLAASRFRDDSELAAPNRATRRDDVDAELSPLLRACLKAALRTVDLTDGLVTPTVGRALVAAGYDRDIDQIDRHSGIAGAFVPDYRRISLRGKSIRMPRGFQLDLGASAKAWAADVLAADLADRLRGGFLVNLGGDIAVAGHAPRADWQIGVEAADGRVLQTVSTRHQAFATSSTQRPPHARDRPGPTRQPDEATGNHRRHRSRSRRLRRDDRRGIGHRGRCLGTQRSLCERARGDARSGIAGPATRGHHRATRSPAGDDGGVGRRGD